MASTKPISAETSKAASPKQLVEVIDVETTSIRTAIGQIDEVGRVDSLETLSRAGGQPSEPPTPNGRPSNRVEPRLNRIGHHEMDIRQVEPALPSGS